jgi:PAS domain S-box-containing protein
MSVRLKSSVIRFSLGIVLLPLLLAGAVAQAPSGAPVDEPEGERFQLRAGIYQNPPKIFLDEEGVPAGLFPDVLAALSEKAGWAVSYHPCAWADCLAMLEAGEIDLMPDVAPTPEREALFKFTQVPVLRSWSYVYSRPGTIVQNFEDMAGGRVAVLRDSVQHGKLAEMRQEQGLSFEIVPTARHNETLEAVAAGRADFGIVNQSLGEALQSGFDLTRSQFVFQPTALYFAFAPGTPDGLLAEVDRYMAAMKTDPQSAYFTALEKWMSPAGEPALPAWVIWAIGGAALLLFAGAGVVALLRRQVAQVTQAVRLSEEKLIRAQIIARVGDFAWDLRTNEVIWSEGMRRLLGYDGDLEVNLDTVLADIHHPDDSEWVLNWILEGAAKGARTLGPETYRLRSKDGAVMFVEANIVIEYEEGRAVKIFGTCHDITRQVKSERAILRAKQSAEEASRAKSQFLATMSHELRTPLNAIIGFAEVMQMTAGGTLNASQMERISFILTAGEQLLNLVNDILDLSSIEAGHLRVSVEKVDVGEAVSECIAQVAQLAERGEVSIEDRLPRDVPVLLETDRQRLKQIIINLLSNAVKYNVNGGRVRISGERTSDGFFRLSISDTGIGIPKAKQDKVFETFTRLHPDAMVAGGGAGIGLSLARLLVEKMGGRSGFESEEGQGSTFWCDLPLEFDPEALSENAETGAASSKTGRAGQGL